jgi:hypothetical protein
MLSQLSIGVLYSADVMRQRLQSEPFSLSAQEVLLHQLKIENIVQYFLAADATFSKPINSRRLEGAPLHMCAGGTAAEAD